jgi:xanthine dehydrogenase accessory factor
VYEIALTVAACLRADTRVDVAWVVQTEGISPVDPTGALALTPGGGRIGAVLGGALNDQLADVAAGGRGGRLLSLRVGRLEAQLAGLESGGEARCLLVDGVDLPAELWDRLRERAPVCLVTRLDGDRVVETALYGPETIEAAGDPAARLFAAGITGTAVTAEQVITVLWPVPKLVIVGPGPVADALVAMAGPLGWQAQVLHQVSAAAGVIAGLAGLDKVVVAAHDIELAGPALATALEAPVGYIGALGSRRMQEARADWLASRGITDLDRVHGPAGLDIGAATPAEIAVSVLAEAVAVAAGRAPGQAPRR